MRKNKTKNKPHLKLKNLLNFLSLNQYKFNTYI